MTLDNDVTNFLNNNNTLNNIISNNNLKLNVLKKSKIYTQGNR